MEYEPKIREVEDDVYESKGSLTTKMYRIPDDPLAEHPLGSDPIFGEPLDVDDPFYNESPGDPFFIESDPSPFESDTSW